MAHHPTLLMRSFPLCLPSRPLTLPFASVPRQKLGRLAEGRPPLIPPLSRASFLAPSRHPVWVVCAPIILACPSSQPLYRTFPTEQSVAFSHLPLSLTFLVASVFFIRTVTLGVCALQLKPGPLSSSCPRSPASDAPRRRRYMSKHPSSYSLPLTFTGAPLAWYASRFATYHSAIVPH